ncbi:MAG: hypothetical protein WCZ72_04385 [Gemmobacter sp.]
MPGIKARQRRRAAADRTLPSVSLYIVNLANLAKVVCGHCLIRKRQGLASGAAAGINARRYR